MTTQDLIRLADDFLHHSAELTADEFDAYFSEFLEASGDKIAALAAIHAQASARAEGFKAQKAVYEAAEKAQANIASRVKGRAFELAVKARELGEALPGIRLQKNGGKVPLLFADGFAAASLPFDLQRVTVEADSDAIRLRLAAGEAVEGASLGTVGEHARFVPVSK